MISGAATNLPSWACRFEKSELENNQSNSEAAYQYFQNQYRKAHSEAEACQGQIIEIKTDRDQKVTAAPRGLSCVFEELPKHRCSAVLCCPVERSRSDYMLA